MLVPKYWQPITTAKDNHHKYAKPIATNTFRLVRRKSNGIPRKTTASDRAQVHNSESPFTRTSEPKSRLGLYRPRLAPRLKSIVANLLRPQAGRFFHVANEKTLVRR